MKGTLQAYSEKNGGVLINDRWYSTQGITVTDLLPLKRKAVLAELSADGRTVTRVNADPDVPAEAPRMPMRSARPFGGRSEEENRRIARQACLNTASAIYDMALKTTAGTFNTPGTASVSQVADAIKTEVMRIAVELEAHVYR